ncbi:histidinol phosphatase [Xylanimonas oleitrophica]|uniref:Histidinol phosphatase n=1 Tax=Xylanimonas oleitrophica TaxID=2607479 RepID=A0A2W5WP38_9MICO|nr:ABC transporter ATP-binding protein [Xylanimonas oleitrophica]PZR53137.1 histidinol phosphatase [Xylanimonas oleitrophica]
MTSLSARDITWTAGRAPILDGVDLDARPGEVLGLLGPNGAGKTSLLRILAGLRRPGRGRVLLDGTPIGQLRRREVARRLAIVEQSPEAHTDVSVHDVVSLGRTPHRGTFSALGAEDQAAVTDALAATGLTGWEDRLWSTLSGGEQQRAQLARALAQQPEVIVLDEPTNHLDVRYQLELLALLRGSGLTVVTALHDLNLAARFCDQLVVLQQGRVAAAGSPADVVTDALVRQVYAVEAVVDLSPHTGSPAVTFLGPAHRP